jgi:uncharacterized protein YecE (DUF72 family)
VRFNLQISGPLRRQLPPKQLRADADAERIRNWTQDGRSVFIYYNNDIGGHAFRNALDLRKMLERAI